MAGATPTADFVNVGALALGSSARAVPTTRPLGVAANKKKGNVSVFYQSCGRQFELLRDYAQLPSHLVTVELPQLGHKSFACRSET
jgi:hypothetical protein